MQGKAPEYKSEDRMQFLNSRESGIISAHPKSNGRMVKAATPGKGASNVTFKELIGMTPRKAMHGEKDVSSEYSNTGLGSIKTSSAKNETAHAKSK